MSDDDDGPVFFKRNSAIRKESQLEGTRKQQSLNNRNVMSDKCSPGTDSVSIKNDRATASPNHSFNRSEITKLESSNLSPAKPPLNSVELCETRKQNICLPEANDSSVKEENDLGKLTDVKSSISEDSEDEKPLIYRRSSLVKKGDPKSISDGPSKKGIGSLKSDDIINHNDIDDDKPLSSRVYAGSGKGDSQIPIKNHMNSASRAKIVAVAKESAEELFETKEFSRGGTKEETDIVKNSCKRSIHEISPTDKKVSPVSDDEMPILKRFQMKSSAEASTSAPYEHKINKSISSTLHQNGSLERGNTFKKAPNVITKRPSGEINSDRNSSVKRPKIPPDIAGSKIKLPSPKEDLDDDVPISQRMTKSTIRDNKVLNVKKIMNRGVSAPLKRESVIKKSKLFSKYSKSSSELPSSGEGQKWITLEHNGVIFPPPYKRHGVKMLYDGKPVDLNIDQEEVATMFAVMKDTDYATKPRFIENFMTDWKKKLGVNHVIQDFSLCDFTPIYEWHQKEKELKKQMTSEEKNALKEEKLKMEEKFMWAVVDGVKEKVGNFRVEPPGLFRGRGEHPKMGKLKRRIRPSDITINIGKNAPIPECHIPGESWKEIKHDNTVTWLAFWNDPITSKEFKYVFLSPSSSLKGQSDREKYEKARSLRNYIHDIRTAYTSDFNSSNPMRRQIAVATYLIDKLALRAGNEKDDDEADTVGCCTLKVENVKPIPPNILQFDFLGKDSIRYENEVEVELPVYAAIQQFRVGKDGGDGLFDQLDTAKLNAHLKELMPGLTAKVFRTYNASSTLDEMLHSDTKDGILEEKLKVYQLANKQVAIICNHQRTISKSHDSQMSRMTEKIDELKMALMELKTDLSKTKRGKALSKDDDGKQKRNMTPDMIEKKIEQINIKIEKMELSKQVKEDLKTVALSTSKVSYLDPRITVAWCKRHEVKIEKIFNKSLLAKFAWAMDVSPGFRF